MTPDDFKDEARKVVDRGYNVGLVEAVTAALHQAYQRGKKDGAQNAREQYVEQFTEFRTKLWRKFDAALSDPADFRAILSERTTDDHA